MGSNSTTDATTQGNLLKVKCMLTNMDFLVDTGASISLIPKSEQDKVDQQCNLKAANGTRILTYGKETIKTKFHEKLPRWHTFTKAAILQPILGADYLAKHGLSICMKKMYLMHNKTHTKVYGSPSYNHIHTVTYEHCDEAKALLNKYPQLLYCEGDKPPLPDSNTPHLEIITEGRLPVNRARRLNPVMLQKAKNHFHDLLQRGIIVESTSPFCSPLHVVPKPNGKERYTVDFRGLNKITKPNRYSLPFLSDSIHDLANKKYFSKLDLREAFHFVPIKPEDVEKTATITPFGTFNWRFMPFGLKNAANQFQLFIDMAFRNLYRTNPDGSKEKVSFFIYLDDILVASPCKNTHRLDLEAIFQRLAEKNLKLNENKCQFFQKEIVFLGHTLSQEGIKPSQDKVKAILDYQKPTTLGGVKRFLGTMNFFKKFIPNAAGTMGPLNDLMKGYNKSKRARKVEWSDQLNNAFSSIKQKLASATMLAYPQQDADIALFADSSDHSVGACLAQKKYGSDWQPLGFFSKELNKTERLGSTFQKEVTAIFKALKYFQNMLTGFSFTIFTDHKTIPSAVEKQSPTHSVILSRMLNYISSYGAKIQHIKGSENFIADKLSRPKEECYLIMHADIISTQELIKEQQLCPELKDTDTLEKYSLKLKTINGILCDISQEKPRPILPISLRYKAFLALHNMSHQGVNRTQQFIASRFVWPFMKKQIKLWTRACIACQKTKITKHNRTLTEPINLPCKKFSHVNIDLVGPLYPSQGNSYLLTVVDRFSSFFQCVPIPNATAKVVLDAFMLHWTSLFGTPIEIILDNGSCFKSHMFQDAMKVLGIKLNFTNSYYPQSNGYLERFHRVIKNSIKAAISDGDPGTWSERLALCLLGLRNSVVQSIKTSPSIVAFGMPTRLPGEIICATENMETDPSIYAEKLRSAMRTISPSNPTFRAKIGYKEPNLDTCEYVFVRDMHRKHGLANNYMGPFKIAKRHEKFMEVDFGSKTETIALHRIRAAHIIPEPQPEVVMTGKKANANQPAITHPPLANTNFPLAINPPQQPVNIPNTPPTPSPSNAQNPQNDALLREPQTPNMRSQELTAAPSNMIPPDNTNTPHITPHEATQRIDISWRPNPQNLRASFQQNNNLPNRNNTLLRRLADYNKPGFQEKNPVQDGRTRSKRNR